MLGAIEKEKIDCIEGVGDCTDRRTSNPIHLMKFDSGANRLVINYIVVGESRQRK